MTTGQTNKREPDVGFGPVFDRLARQPQHLRIRRCHGNQACWCIVRLRADGSESDAYGSYITGYSLDRLLSGGAKNLTPRAGDTVELTP